MKLVLTPRFREYNGELQETSCVITGNYSLFYDIYEDENGREVLVSANASRKIQDFVRRRDAIKCTEPMEFVIYGRQVTIIDRRQPALLLPEEPDGSATPALLSLPG